MRILSILLLLLLCVTARASVWKTNGVVLLDTNTTSFTVDIGTTNGFVDYVALDGTNGAYKYFGGMQPAAQGTLYAYYGDSAGTATNLVSSMLPVWTNSLGYVDDDVGFNFGSQTRAQFWKFQWAATNLSSKCVIGQIEIHYVATNTLMNCILMPTNYSSYEGYYMARWTLAVGLSELTGQAWPAITDASLTNSIYTGTVIIVPDYYNTYTTYSAATNAWANGSIPTNQVYLNKTGRFIQVGGSSMANIQASVLYLLRHFGARFVYPDLHGSYYPSIGTNLDWSWLPVATNEPAYRRGFSSLESWFFPYQYQTVPQPYREQYTEFCRLGWFGFSENGPFFPQEIPKAASSSIPAPYLQITAGSPHNMGIGGNGDYVMPSGVLATNYPSLWFSGDGGSTFSTNGNYIFAMGAPYASTFVSAEIAANVSNHPWDSFEPLSPRPFNHSYNLLPIDAATFSSDTNSANANALYGGPPVTSFGYSSSGGPDSSGSYYLLISNCAVANPTVKVGGLAYYQVMTPPTNNYPSNVRFGVTQLGGQWQLPPTNSANSSMKSVDDLWAQRVSDVFSYKYALLHWDYWQTNYTIPFANVDGIRAWNVYLTGKGYNDDFVQGTIESWPYNPWNFYGYIRSLQNTNLSTDTILTEFFTNYFAEAAVPMRAYYDTLANAQTNTNIRMIGYCYTLNGQANYSSLATMYQDLTNATALATNLITQNRVRFIGVGFTNMLTAMNLVGSNLTDTTQFQTASNQTLNCTDFNAPSGWGYIHVTPNVYGNHATATGNGWTFGLGFSAIKKTFYFPAAGTNVITFTAKNTGSTVSMQVNVDGDSQTKSINSASFTSFSVTNNVPAAGIRTVVINDFPTYGSGQDFVLTNSIAMNFTPSTTPPQPATNNFPAYIRVFRNR